MSSSSAYNHDDEEAYESIEDQSPWTVVWQNNKGATLILLAEALASSSDAIVRFLQQGGHGMHPFQVIFFRMITTLILSTFYMWWMKVPDFPLGAPSVRPWLLLRSAFGFCGLFCLYYSVHYLPLAEATVFRFMIPTVTAWACSVFLGQTFTRKELIAGLVALVGVVMIAHPSAIFGPIDDGINVNSAGPVDKVTPTERLIAIVVSLLGVIGASGAYTSIRVIGDRAHALMSVNYFAGVGTFGSALALLIIPGISFTMPQGPREWILVLMLGIFGFGLQFLLTAGLQLDRSSKATSMMYSQVIFALIFDWAIWGVLPVGWSIVGGCVVTASTLWSALQKPHQEKRKVKTVDEESSLLGEDRPNVVEYVVRRGSLSA